MKCPLIGGPQHLTHLGQQRNLSAQHNRRRTLMPAPSNAAPQAFNPTATNAQLQNWLDTNLTFALSFQTQKGFSSCTATLEGKPSKPQCGPMLKQVTHTCSHTGHLRISCAESAAGEGLPMLGIGRIGIRWLSWSILVAFLREKTQKCIFSGDESWNPPQSSSSLHRSWKIQEIYFFGSQRIFFSTNIQRRGRPWDEMQMSKACTHTPPYSHPHAYTHEVDICKHCNYFWAKFS